MKKAGDKLELGIRIRIPKAKFCIYRLRPLDDTASEELLAKLAPIVARGYKEECHRLAVSLGGLPIGLQVAGRLLHAESEGGGNIDSLLRELETTSRVLRERVPTPVASETNPTIAVHWSSKCRLNHALQADWNPAQLLASLAMPSRLYLEHTLVLGSSG